MAKKAKSKKTYSDEELAAMTSAQLEKLLPEKQRRFVRELVLNGGNGTQAAIAAGYKAGKDNHTAAVTAARLLKDPVIVACRIAIQKEAFRRMGVTLESVCTELVEIKNRCMQAVPVMEWDRDKKEYVETGEYTFDAKGATRALTELANLLGLKEQSRGPDTVRVELMAAAEFAE